MAKEDFKKLEPDVIEFFNNVKMQLSFPIDLKIIFQSAAKQKHLIKITKIPDHYSSAFSADLLVQINETYFDNFDEEINTILVEQELGRLEFNLDKGTFKLVKPDFATTFGMITKYSSETVQRAIETEKLFEQQKEEDKDEDVVMESKKKEKEINMVEVEELKYSIKKLKKIADILKDHTFEIMKSRIDYINSEEYINYAQTTYKPNKEDPYSELEQYIKELRNIATFNEVLDNISSILYVEEVQEIIEDTENHSKYVENLLENNIQH